MKRLGHRTLSCAVSASAGACVLLVLVGGAVAQQGWEPVVHQGEGKPVIAPKDTKGHVEKATHPGAEKAGATAELPKAEVTATPALLEEALRTRPEGSGFETAAARQYCVHIADAAAEAKFAWQKKLLTDLGKEIDERVERLEAKTAEYRTWLARRDEFAKRAQDSLVLIYSRMKPDAAALQLAAMDEETAAAVLIKLDVRTASTILNEMDPAQAARLTSTISGAARTTPGASSAATPEGKKS
jgi:flagellar motility protein MotE (MotC chaperone)